MAGTLPGVRNPVRNKVWEASAISPLKLKDSEAEGGICEHSCQRNGKHLPVCVLFVDILAKFLFHVLSDELNIK